MSFGFTRKIDDGSYGTSGEVPSKSLVVGRQ